LVQGLASVRDADLQANTDRYVRLTMSKLPAAFKGQPKFMLRGLGAYFARIWIEVTPTRILWWPSKALDTEPQEWVPSNAPAATSSDPAPGGHQPPPWLEPPREWRTVARDAIRRLEQRDLAWIGVDGPVAAPIPGLAESDDGFKLTLGPHLPERPEGPATLTLHAHPASFTSQENHTFVGEIAWAEDSYVFRVERLLADVSLAGNTLTRSIGFLRKVRRLRPRLQEEAARRGQPVPTVRLPGDR
jgi:hypothetical protein